VNANEHLPAPQDAMTVGPSPSTSTQRRVVALTRDPALSRALEELAGLNVAVVQTSTLDALAEQLVEAGSAIAMLDAAAIDRPIDHLVDRLVTQFPDLRIIVAGHSLEQNLLATRISQGTVFRFVHKPASAQRLKLFVDAANRPSDAAKQAAPAAEPQKEAARASASAAPSGPEGPLRGLPKPALIGGAVALVAIVAGAAVFFGGDDKPAPAAAPVVTAPVPASAAVEALIRDADQAFAAQRFAGRDGTSAAELYQKAQQAAPQDPRARSGFTRSLDFALRSAEIAFTENRFADAESIIGSLQAISPNNSRLSFLSTQLQRERERSTAEENRRLSVEARQEKLRSTLQQANERLRRGALIEPERDSALEMLFAAQDLAPSDADVRALRERLSNRLLETASQKLDAGDVTTARPLLDAAGSLGTDSPALAKLRRRADEITAATVAASTSPPARPAADTAPAPTLTPVVASTSAASTPVAAAPASAAAQSPPSARSGDTIRIYAPSELTQTRTAEVVYPERALTQKISGWAEVEFTIETDGSVKNVIVTNSEPKGMFDANTTQAVRRWRYKPVMENGKAIEARSRVRLRFTPAKD
jgi:protein TonB